jgi:pimeloyl-ACP methyl ester carboxylesterase
MRILILFFGLLILKKTSTAQSVTPDAYGLKEFSIHDKKLGLVQFYVDTVNIHRKAPLLIEVNGSGGLPLCLYVKGNKFVTTPTTFNQELFSKTSDKYHYVILGKPGTSFCDTLNLDVSVKEYQENPSQVLFVHKPSEEYTRRLSLNWRVQATRLAISYLIDHGFWDKTKIVAFGYSEGGQVVPSLAVEEKRVTHIAPVVGSGLNQLYDGIMKWRIKAAKGELTQQQAQDSVEVAFSRIADIYKNPTSTDKETGGHAYLRWASFGTTIPFEQLRKLSIPIYMIAASQDDSSPIYGLDYVRLEFLRLGKTNLVYDTCVGCNHYLSAPGGGGNANGPTYIDKILKWVEGR